MGNDRPEEDLEYPAMAGMSPCRLGLGARIGLSEMEGLDLGFVGSDERFVGLVVDGMDDTGETPPCFSCSGEVDSLAIPPLAEGLRKVCGFEATDGFLPSPFGTFSSPLIAPSLAPAGSTRGFRSGDTDALADDGDCSDSYFVTMSVMLPFLIWLGRPAPAEAEFGSPAEEGETSGLKPDEEGEGINMDCGRTRSVDNRRKTGLGAVIPGPARDGPEDEDGGRPEELVRPNDPLKAILEEEGKPA